MEQALAVKESDALGDSPDAFITFYESMLPRVYGYFYYRCNGFESVAEDLTQETFITAAALLKRGERIRSPRAWVLAIARHKLLEHYRREARIAESSAVSWDSWAEDGGSRVTWPPPRADDLWRERTLTALTSLPASQRQALILRHLDGLPVAQIASLLGRSVHATESLLARGRSTFKQRYQEVREDVDESAG
jgi:RNA polymerase sigma-70 factor (ECF subfamily)